MHRRPVKMYCKKCGCEIKAGQTFCGKCGVPAGTAKTAMSAGGRREDEKRKDFKMPAGGVPGTGRI